MAYSVSVGHQLMQRSFVSLFHRLPEAGAEAPGWVNLMGDHTDYNGGYMLPMVLPLTTQVEVAARADSTIHVWSGNVDPPQAHREFLIGGERRGQGWLDYVQAIATVIRAEGHALPGMDLRISSEVPMSAGLSSSAALLVALVRAIRNLLHLDLSEVDIARLAHRAEMEVVGAVVAMGEPLVCALGRPETACFLDTATQDAEQIVLPTAAEWVLIHSGMPHGPATGSYDERRRECEAASSLLGLRWIRDLEGAGRQEVMSRIEELPAPLNARARHVITENERVLTGVELLEQGRMDAFGALMNASHASLRHDFAVSVPETDLLVDLAHEEEAVYGARLTGGGFGGSVVIAVETGTASQVAARIAGEYRVHSGRDGHVLLPPSSG